MEHAPTRIAERRKDRKPARRRMASSGSEVQPWYGLTEIDDEMATAVHYQRRDIGGELLYDLRFSARDMTVVHLMDLDAAEVRNAVGDVNAWAIATAESATGVLSNSALAGAYGLSPREALRRAAEHRGRTAPCTAPEPHHHPRHELDQAHELATVRKAVEEAAHLWLSDGIPNPVARRRFVMGMCQRLQFTFTGGEPPETETHEANTHAAHAPQGRRERSGTRLQTERMR